MLKKRRLPRWDLKSEIIQNHVNNDRGLIWTSSNGRTQSIAVMDINHIRNAINKIKRGELDNRKNMVPVLEMELHYRAVCELNEQKDERREGQISDSVYGLEV